MSPQFGRVHHPPLLLITDRFPQQQYCLRCLSTLCQFVLDDLWNAMMFHNTLSGRIGKVVTSHAEGCKVEKSNPGCV